MVHLPPDVIFSFLTHLALMKLNLARHYGFNLREFLLLGVLAKGGQLSFKRLGNVFGIPKSALTGLVDSLSAKGLVERRQHQEDRRQWLASLSPLGQKLNQKMQEEETQALLPFVAELSEADQQAFLKVVQTFTGELTEAQRPVAADRGVKPRSKLNKR